MPAKLVRQFGLQVPLPAKHNVGSIFCLHKAPVTAVGKVTNDRTVFWYDLVELTMKVFSHHRIGQFLSFAKVIDLDKGIVEHLKAYTFSLEIGRQLMMAIVIELQAERRPGGHPQIAQAKLRANEVELIMQTPAGDRLKISLVGLFIMPWLIASTRLHRREYMYQSGMRASLFYNLIDPVFIAEVLLSDKLDLQTILCGQVFGIGTDIVAQRLCPFGIVENPNVLGFKKSGHALGITNTGNRAGQYYAVKARKHPLNLTGMAVDKLFHGWQYLPNYLYTYWSNCRAG